MAKTSTSQRGRGWLSSFDLLPKEADHIISWAASELADREKTQTDIYKEFVTRCEALMAEYRGELKFVIPSIKSFNRFSIRQARMTRRMDETREMVAGLVEKYDASSSDNLTIMVGEMIKSVAFNMMGEGADGIAPKDLKALADAARAAQLAQNISTDRRAKIETSMKDKISQAIDKVAKVKGLK